MEIIRSPYRLTSLIDVKKTAVACLNSAGGILTLPANIFSGDILKTVLQAIKPAANAFARVTCDQEKIVLSIAEGNKKPYYLSEIGLDKGGVFIVKNDEVTVASKEVVLSLIEKTGGEIFEKRRSYEQDLAFEATRFVFGQYKIPFAVNLRDEDDLYTNFAYLLADSCSYQTIVKTDSDRRFSGSLFAQYANVYAYLSSLNRLTKRLSDRQIIDDYDYPPEALKEALINALSHRDYTRSEPIIIRIGETSIEFISPGGLVDNLSLTDLKNGASLSRNEEVARVFRRVYGSKNGLSVIEKSYADCELKPRVVISSDYFKIALPKRYARIKIIEAEPLKEKKRRYRTAPAFFANKEAPVYS